MRITIINTGDSGSTGTICLSLCQFLLSTNHEVQFLVKNKSTSYSFVEKCYSGKINDFLNKVFSRIDGRDCFLNKKNTYKIIDKIAEFKPDIVHIHNVHGSYLNIEMLLKYLNSKKIPIIWTLHDCWAYTGRCACYDFNSCYKWESECKKCRYRDEYPKALFLDRTKQLFIKKKSLFTNSNIVYTVPSLWLRKEISKSFLSKEKIFVINNGIKKSERVTLKDIESRKEQLCIKANSKVIFAASFSWCKQKGLDYIKKLSFLVSDSNIVFVIAGLGKRIERQNNIIYIPKISTRKEMNLYFSMADAFINPTLQDNFPTVNIESLMNGTPVITFNTGGSPEILNKETGVVVEKGDLEGLRKAVFSISKNCEISKKCIEWSQQFLEKEMSKNYYDLYQKIIKQ